MIISKQDKFELIYRYFDSEESYTKLTDDELCEIIKGVVNDNDESLFVLLKEYKENLDTLDDIFKHYVSRKAMEDYYEDDVLVDEIECYRDVVDKLEYGIRAILYAKYNDILFAWTDRM